MAHIADKYPALAELFDVGARFIKYSTKAPAKLNKYNPQSCNRSGEALRRIRAVERRQAQSMERARKWLENNPLPKLD
jgi:hypothetical protein